MPTTDILRLINKFQVDDAAGAGRRAVIAELRRDPVLAGVPDRGVIDREVLAGSGGRVGIAMFGK